MEQESSIPVVMCFAGLDPTGGAGLQADIETIASMGGHCAPVLTTVTVQDTQGISGYMPMDMNTIIEQARAVLEDMSVNAFKIGMLGSAEAAEAIHTILEDYSDLPVIFDPVLASGNGTPVVDHYIKSAMCDLIIPNATIMTPNSLEARALATEADTLDACAHELMDLGAEYVLITGSHENSPKVKNTLYCNSRQLDCFEWERLPHQYHGSGCTLASAIAGLMGQGLEPLTAVFEAQQYTWQTLQSASRLGMGQYIPNRFFWAQSESEETEDEGELV